LLPDWAMNKEKFYKIRELLLLSGKARENKQNIRKILALLPDWAKHKKVLQN
jgi:hypothetical protein